MSDGKNVDREKSCERKKGYDTIEQARRALAYVWTQTGANLKVYQCRYCGKFHLTHKLDFDPGDAPGKSKSVFVTSPNFSGNRKPECWDHNDLELREKRKVERAEQMKKEMEDLRPPTPVLSKWAMVEKPEGKINPEAYISGKNRHKHKMAALRKVTYCRKCGKPIRVSTDVQLCDDCIKDTETIRAMERFNGSMILDATAKNKRKRK